MENYSQETSRGKKLKGEGLKQKIERNGNQELPLMDGHGACREQ